VGFPFEQTSDTDKGDLTMYKKLPTILIITVLILSGCMFIPDKPAKVKGSGNIISETRNATGFTSISLEGSADVKVVFGDAESVVVMAEDNIVPLIETNIQDHQLIIKTVPNMTFLATKPVLVNVTMISLDGVSISGMGNIDVVEVAGDSFRADLIGSGNIVLSGAANTVNLSLTGTGNIYGDQLKTKIATMVLGGMGNITVFASNKVDATISGSGDIRYSGSPINVIKNISGTGRIYE